MRRITVFDTYVQSANLGDAIIMDYSLKQLREMFKTQYFFHASTHEYNRRASYKFMRHTKDQLVCGTNLLHDKMYLFNQWKINWLDALFLNATLMGVGASGYYGKLDFYSKMLYKAVLSSQRTHSVRDAYTEDILHKAGIKNVINTGCQTTWLLTPEFVKGINKTRAENVITTITDYDGFAQLDVELIRFLSKNYKTVYFWPQGFDDIKLLKKLGVDHLVTLLSPSLQAFDEALSLPNVEYIGTRLHAGIRALNFKKRALILAVDNRAIEMSKSNGLPVIMRKDLMDYLPYYIDRVVESSICIAEDKIQQWKAQF